MRRAARLLSVAAALGALTVPAATAAARDGLYRGRTTEGAPVSLRVADGRVTVVALAFSSYVCDPEGEIGPLRADPTTGGRLSPAGGFGFSTGPRSQRVRLDGRVGRNLIRGSARMTGTIAIGHPCRSPRVRFSARRG